MVGATGDPAMIMRYTVSQAGFGAVDDLDLPQVSPRPPDCPRPARARLGRGGGVPKNTWTAPAAEVPLAGAPRRGSAACAGKGWPERPR